MHKARYRRLFGYRTLFSNLGSWGGAGLGGRWAGWAAVTDRLPLFTIHMKAPHNSGFKADV